MHCFLQVRFRIWAVAWLCLGACGAAVHGAEEEVLVDERTTCIDLIPQASYLVDPTQAITVDTAKAEPLRHQFRAKPWKHPPNFGFSRDTHWVRYSVRSRAQAPSTWFIELGRLRVDWVGFYVVAGDRVVYRREAGNTVPWASRDVPVRPCVFKLALEPGAQAEVYMAFRSEAALWLPLHLWGPDAFWDQYLHGEQWNLLYFGYMLALTIVAIFLAVATRDKGYLLYTFTTLSFVCFLFLQMQYPAALGLPGLAFWARRGVLLPLIFSGPSFLYYTRYFLDLPKQSPRTDRILVWVAGGTLLAGLAAIPASYSALAQVVNITSQLCIACGFTVSALHMLRGHRVATLYMAAWSAFLLMISLRIFAVFGWLSAYWAQDYMVQWTTVFGYTLFLLALVNRIRQMDRDKLAAQTRWLELQQTERSRAEQLVRQRTTELQAEKENLDAIFESSPVGMLVLDQHLSIVRANAAAITLATGSAAGLLQQRPGQSLQCLHNTEDDRGCGFSPNCALCPLRHGLEVVLNEGRPLRGAELSMTLRRDGQPTTVWFRVGAEPLQLDRQRYVIVALDDITARKHAEAAQQTLAERIQKVQKKESLVKLAGGVAHDFNNLLQVVSGNAELALQDLPPGAAGRTAIQDLMGSVERMTELTRQMLVYSGGNPFVPQPVDIHRLVDELQPQLRAMLPARITLTCHLASDLPPLMGDEALLRQALLHLVHNAGEAIGDQPGDVVIRTRLASLQKADLTWNRTPLHDDLAPGDYVTLEVSDTGPGMDEKTQAHLFDPFFSTKFMGRGLGLPVVSGIMHTHQGAIFVTSAPGQGASFRLAFPVHAQAALTTGANTPAAAARADRTHVILVVDDDPEILKIACRFLESANHQVLTAESGAEALTLLQRHADELGLVLLDLKMPAPDGLAVFREIRRRRPQLPVLIASGYGELDLRERFGPDQPDGFLSKPYNRATLLAQIARYVS